MKIVFGKKSGVIFLLLFVLLLLISGVFFLFRVNEVYSLKRKVITFQSNAQTKRDEGVFLFGFQDTVCYFSLGFLRISCIEFPKRDQMFITVTIHRKFVDQYIQNKKDFLSEYGYHVVTTDQIAKPFFTFGVFVEILFAPNDVPALISFYEVRL